MDNRLTYLRTQVGSMDRESERKSQYQREINKRESCMLLVERKYMEIETDEIYKLQRRATSRSRDDTHRSKKNQKNKKKQKNRTKRFSAQFVRIFLFLIWFFVFFGYIGAMSNTILGNRRFPIHSLHGCIQPAAFAWSQLALLFQVFSPRCNLESGEH
tara:strand:- start:395 stop:868 length:474 start_codon:yes stop_codon:yes gene_type:complete